MQKVGKLKALLCSNYLRSAFFISGQTISKIFSSMIRESRAVLIILRVDCSFHISKHKPIVNKTVLSFETSICRMPLKARPRKVHFSLMSLFTFFNLKKGLIIYVACGKHISQNQYAQKVVKFLLLASTECSFLKVESISNVGLEWVKKTLPC